MTRIGWLQILLYFLAILLLTKPMGVFLYRVFERKGTFLDFLLRPVERLIYRISGIDEEREMNWIEYGIAMLLFSGVSLILLYGIELGCQRSSEAVAVNRRCPSRKAARTHPRPIFQNQCEVREATFPAEAFGG